MTLLVLSVEMQHKCGLILLSPLCHKLLYLISMSGTPEQGCKKSFYFPVPKIANINSTGEESMYSQRGTPDQTNSIVLYKACEPPVNVKTSATFDAFKRRERVIKTFFSV